MFLIVKEQNSSTIQVKEAKAHNININSLASFVVNKDTERSEILIKFKVKTPGKMNIKGVITKCCNVVCYHPINERGDSLHYIQTSGKNIQPQKDARGVIETFNLREVIVRDPYPSLQVKQ